jgi:GT2 family glycosyltransferase
MMPFDPGLNLGRAYNEAMALLPDEAWAVLLDHDMLFTTKDWYRQIAEAIRCQPTAGAFTVMTNRIAAPWQQIGERENHDLAYHYRFGLERTRVRTLLDITGTNGFGGVVIVVSKAAWQAVGGFADGLLCVDHSLHFRLRAAGYRNWLIEGLYVYHRRRAFPGGALPTGTPRAARCPCSGREQLPTVRVTLP